VTSVSHVSRNFLEFFVSLQLYSSVRYFPLSFYAFFFSRKQLLFISLFVIRIARSRSWTAPTKPPKRSVTLPNITRHTGTTSCPSVLQQQATTNTRKCANWHISSPRQLPTDVGCGCYAEPYSSTSHVVRFHDRSNKWHNKGVSSH
jgi:hypothetical protein